MLLRARKQAGATATTQTITDKLHNGWRDDDNCIVKGWPGPKKSGVDCDSSANPEATDVI